MRHDTTRHSFLLAGLVGALISLSAPEIAPAHGRDHKEGAGPDRTAPYAGGIAARVHVDAREPVPGEIYLLMAQAGSTYPARTYDETPFRHEGGEHEDTTASNLSALDAAEELVDGDLDFLEMTSAPAGGPSGGLAYALAYLNVATEGRLTDGLRVAASGTITSDGYVGPVTAIDEKVAAASLADAAVLFSASIPDDEVIAAHGARFVGEMRWLPIDGASLAEERHWDRYQRWGEQRPDGVDVVAVRHLGDVISYLCGAGSVAACELAEGLADRPGVGAASAEPLVEGSREHPQR